MNDLRRLNQYAEYLISQFDKDPQQSNDQTISVNPVVSEVATWYEKLRNAMDYREEDVILRAAIERILKRRLILGGSGKTVAEPLVRELVWARYFPDNTIPESITSKVEKCVDLYFKLQTHVLNSGKKINRAQINEWIMHLLSSELEQILNQNKEKELLINLIFQIYKEKIEIVDDNEEAKNAQIFIAIRRTFAKEDQPLLRYSLFIQLFDHLTEENLKKTAENFTLGIKKIDSMLNYPLKDRIYTYIKRQIIPFFILEDILKSNRGKNKNLVLNEVDFKLTVINTVSKKYENIKSKVGTAIVRGVIFIFITKAIFALGLESNFENLIYGAVNWATISINTVFPPVLMVIVGLSIKTPGKDNSLKIYEKIGEILFGNFNEMGKKSELRKNTRRKNPILNLTFIMLWLLGLFLALYLVNFLLNLLEFNKISKVVFVFFLAIVSFISYRISQTAHSYTVLEEKQNLKSVLFDFFFMPLIHLGRDLTENISKLNIFLFIFDMIIETPFKVIFGFFEQWFLYLRTQREKLG